MKKFLSILLTVMLMLSVIPLGLFSITASAATSGTTGDCTWSLDGTVLTISGNGKMQNYGVSYSPPWGKSVTEVIIKTGVTSIGNYAFRGCKELASVTIPDSVTNIGDYSFEGCTGLTNITIPDSVTIICDRAFYDCTNLKEVHINDIAKWCSIKFSNDYSNPLSYAQDLYLNDELITNLVIPEGVTNIGEEAFSGCTGLASITIPDSVTSISWDAFDGCTNLKEVHINDIAKWCSIEFKYRSSNPLYYAHNLYLKGELITNLVIPNSVTSIGYSAFSGCTGLTSITIPDSVTTIGDSAFSGCSKLENLTIKGAERLYESCFSSCNSLKNIYLSKDLKTVYNGAFDETDNIENIYYEGSEEEWNAVTILPNNDALKKANVYFNSTGIPDEVPTAPELLKKTACTVTLKHIDGYEYRMNDGEWQSSNVFTGLNPNTEYKFYRRTAASDESPAGAASYALTVITSEIIRGDINDDREVNILDLISLKKFFADPLNNVVPSVCLDVSGDGRINSADLAALRKNLLLQ